MIILGKRLSEDVDVVSSASILEPSADSTPKLNST